MEQAEGRYIKFLDDDDKLIPGALTEEMRALRQTEAALSVGHLEEYSEGRSFVFEQEPAPDIVSRIFRGELRTHPPVFLYRSSVLSGCRWDPAIPYHQDTAFAVEVTTQGIDWTLVDCPVALYRNHTESSISNDVKSQATAVERAKLQVRLIERGIRRLRKRNTLKDFHCEAAAEGMWTWAHIIAAYDWDKFTEVYDTIRSIRPNFEPSRQGVIMKRLDALFGPKGTEYVTKPFRTIKRMVLGR